MSPNAENLTLICHHLLTATVSYWDSTASFRIILDAFYDRFPYLTSVALWRLTSTTVKPV